jgi:hypothetical protein
VVRASSGTDRSLTKARDLAWAEAFAGLARVSSTLATRLRQIHEDAPTEEVEVPPESSPAPAKQTRLPRGGFGPRQQQVLALTGLDTAEGVSVADVSAAFGWKRSNTHNLMTRLEELGALQRMPDERPTRWQRAAG